MSLNIGNRRSEEDLLKLKIATNKETIVLVEQTNFKGNEHQLEQMQNFERAYISGSPIISDEEWDILKYKYNYKESVTPVSPSGRSWLKLIAPLPSLDKAPEKSYLLDYLNKFPNGDKRLELKLDGLTANVRYKYIEESGKYIRTHISSRGNGYYGLVLNPFALNGVKLNVPDYIDEIYIKEMLNKANKSNIITWDQNLPKEIEFRGEAVIRKSIQNKQKYGEFATWRNIASGMFNRKIPNNTKGLFQYFLNENVNNNPNVELSHKSDKDIEESILSIKGSDRHTITGSYINDDNLLLSFDKLSRTDKVLLKCVNKNGNEEYLVSILRNTGEIEELPTKTEDLDIVVYSMGYQGDNIDTEYLNLIPGIKTLDQIQYEQQVEHKFDNLNPLEGKNFYVQFKSNEIDQIWDKVEEFYGVKDGKRNSELPRYRNLMEYACDGIVIKPLVSNTKTQGLGIRNNKNNPNKILMSKYPDDQIAVKLISEVVRVKLEQIVYKETSLGNKTCSGILDKAYRTESGALVQNINLHNVDWLAQNDWIKEGNEYDMIMAMDIIPQFINPSL